VQPGIWVGNLGNKFYNLAKIEVCLTITIFIKGKVATAQNG